MRNWIQERFEVYARSCLIAALVVSPVIFLKSTVGVFAVTKLAVMWSLAVVSLAFWTIWRLNGGTPLAKTLILRYAAIFVAISALATAFSPYRLTALVGNYFVYGGLVSLELYFVIAFLVFALYWKRPFELQDLCKAGATAAFLVTGYQFIQEAGLDWHTWRLSGNVAPWEGGTLGNPNFTGGFLGASLPFALYLTFNSKESTTQRLFALLTFLQLTALWMTAARGGLAAAIAAAAVFAIVYRRKIPSNFKRGAGAAACLLLVAVVITASQAKPDPSTPESEPTVLGVSVSPKALVETRFDFWRSAVRIILDHPILGTGPDTYYANYPSTRPAENGGDPNLQLENNAHNIFLTHGVGSGLLGLGTFIFLIGSTLLVAVRKLRKLTDPKYKLLLTTFIAVLIAYLTQGFVSIDHVPLAGLGWMAIGAIVVLAEPGVEKARQVLEASAMAQRSQKTQQRRFRRRLAAPVTAVIVGALILLSLGARLLVSDVKAQTSTSAPSLNDRATFLRQAFELNPAESEYHHLAGATLHGAAINTRVTPQDRDQLFREGRSQYLQALARRPGSVIYLVSLARLDTAWGQTVDKQHFVTAGESWRRVIAMDPNNYRWHLQYSEMLLSSALADNKNPQLIKAQISELRRSIGIYRQQPVAWKRLAQAYRDLGDTAQAEAVTKEFFGGDTTLPAPVAPPDEASTSPFRAALGITLALGVPLLAGFLWLRKMLFRAGRREKDSKKKAQKPDVLHELIAAAGLVCLVVAVPRMGALLGVGLGQGDLKELMLHVIPGGAALYLAFINAPKPYLTDRHGMGEATLAPFVTFVTSLIAIVVHLPDLFAGGGPKAAGAVLLHVAPIAAILMLVSMSISRRPIAAAPSKRVDSPRESADIA